MSSVELVSGSRARRVICRWAVAIYTMLIFDQLQKADRHLRALSWCIAMALAVLLSGLWWVQVIRSRHYVEDQRNQSYRTVRVPAPRGKILDRNGIALAENQPTYNVSLYLEDRRLRDLFQAEYKKRRALALKEAAAKKKKLTVERQREMGRAARYFVVSNIVAELGDALAQPLAVDEQKFHRHYEQRLALPMPVVSSLTSTQVARLQVRALNLPGVEMDVRPLRWYPNGTLAAHVLGYLTHSDESAEDELSFYNYRLPDYRGLSGIEAALDESLRGKAGAKSVLVNNLGYRQTETVLAPVEAGKDVTLTLDVDIQRVAERALAAAHGVASPVRGAAVVLDVRSGEAIAIASAPAFNPNDWVPYLPRTTWDSYTNEDIAPLQNRAVFGNFMPGSTFKIIVALAALEARTLDPNEILKVEPNPKDPNHGSYFAGRYFRDTAPPGDYDFRRAFIKSSNSYFVHHGLLVGPERIVALAQRFHFGERTGIALQESRGLLPTSDWVRQNYGGWSSAAIGNLSIGQGALDVTPLQVAVAMAAVANGGKVLAPQLVLRVRPPMEVLAPVQEPRLRPTVRDQIPVSNQVLNIVREAMLADVEDSNGTGSKARVDGYRVCGKTGTAQVFKGTKFDHYTVWFASYAPFEDPHYSVVVMVDYGASGGGTCAPIAGEIYRALKARDQRLGQPRRDTLAQN